MYNVIIPKEIHNSINNFILNYRNSFLNLYNDTGIVFEYKIKNDYILKSKKFQREIFYSINDLLSQNKIFGYSILENGNFEITIVVGNYRLFIEYFEDNIEKIRFVEKIRFFYK